MKTFWELPTYLHIALALMLAIMIGSAIGMAGAWDVKFSKLPQMPETTKARVIHQDLK